MSCSGLAETPEVRAFHRSAAFLEAGLNPDDVTNALFSEGVITRVDREKITSRASRYEKVEILISAVGTNLATNPGNFRKFVHIVNREPSFGALVKKLNHEYEKAKSEGNASPTAGSYYSSEGLPFPASHPSRQGYVSVQGQSTYSGPTHHTSAGAGVQVGLPHGSGQGQPTHPAPEPKYNDDVVDNHPLSIEDLIDVIEEVEHLANWYDFGLALGLVAPILDMIQEENPRSVGSCKREVLKRWLMKPNQERTPSWQNLVKALRRPLINSHDIANSIAKRHTRGQPPGQEVEVVKPMQATPTGQPS